MRNPEPYRPPPRASAPLTLFQRLIIVFGGVVGLGAGVAMAVALAGLFARAAK